MNASIKHNSLTYLPKLVKTRSRDNLRPVANILLVDIYALPNLSIITSIHLNGAYERGQFLQTHRVRLVAHAVE